MMNTQDIIKAGFKNCPICNKPPFKIDCGIEQIKKGMSLKWFFQCKNCGIQYDKTFIFEEEQTFCNCDLCKKLMA